MGEYEKAMSGRVFVRGNEVLASKRTRAKDLCFRFNPLAPSASEERERIITELIPNRGRNSSFTSPFYCDYGEFISTGENFFSNYDCKILDGAKVIFGDNVLVGPNCTFTTPSHPLDPEQRLTGLQIFLPIKAGHNVWFGSNVTVLGGVSIGDNAVISAGSVVTRDIPSGCLAAGVPCKAIREISEEDRRRFLEDE